MDETMCLIDSFLLLVEEREEEIQHLFKKCNKFLKPDIWLYTAGCNHLRCGEGVTHSLFLLVLFFCGYFWKRSKALECLCLGLLSLCLCVLSCPRVVYFLFLVVLFCLWVIVVMWGVDGHGCLGENVCKLDIYICDHHPVRLGSLYYEVCCSLAMILMSTLTAYLTRMQR